MPPDFSIKDEHGVSRTDLYEKCFNFHSKADKRIENKGVDLIKGDISRLMGRAENQGNLDLMNFEIRKDTEFEGDIKKMKKLRKNDLAVLLESGLQTAPLQESIFERREMVERRREQEFKKLEKKKTIPSQGTKLYPSKGLLNLVKL